MRRLIVFLAVLTAACGENTPATEPAPESLAGTWVLLSVNGERLPTKIGTVAAFDIHWRMRMDSLFLSENGAVRRWTQVEDSTNFNGVWSKGTDNVTDSGTYVRKGNSVTIQLNRADAVVTGFVDGTGMTLPMPGCANVAGCSVGPLTFLFAKR